MENSAKKVFYVIGWMLCVHIQALAQTAHQSLRAGDQAYLQENYTAAQQHYKDVVRQNPGSWSATYNLGCAEYQQGRYPEAEKAFQQAVAGSQLTAAKADAWYNLGNAQLKQHKWGEAIAAYESSLRLQPGDAAAKQNLQMAKQKLKEEQEEEQKRQQKQKQQEQEQAGEQPPNDQKQPSQEQPNGKDGQPQKPQESSGQGEKPTPPTEPGKMTRQEAERMLETTIGPEDRKNARKYRAAVQQKKVPKTNKKDW